MISWEPGIPYDHLLVISIGAIGRFAPLRVVKTLPPHPLGVESGPLQVFQFGKWFREYLAIYLASILIGSTNCKAEWNGASRTTLIQRRGKRWLVSAAGFVQRAKVHAQLRIHCDASSSVFGVVVLRSQQFALTPEDVYFSSSFWIPSKWPQFSNIEMKLNCFNWIYWRIPHVSSSWICPKMVTRNCCSVSPTIL